MSPKKASSLKGKDKQPAVEVPSSTVLSAPRIRDKEVLGKIRGLVGAKTNEWGKTKHSPGSGEIQRQAGPTQPFFVRAIKAGLVPLFSSFLLVIQSLFSPSSPISAKRSWASCPPWRSSATSTACG